MARLGSGGRWWRCARTSTRCRSTRRAAWTSSPSGRARCTPAATTGTRRCCSAPRASCRARAVDGEVRFIFQHAEELAPGGARDLVAAGVMEGVDFIYGCHLWTPLEYGKVAADARGRSWPRPTSSRPRSRAAAATAASPTPPIDTIAAAAEFVGSLQHIVSRRADPLAARRGHDRQLPRRRRAERDPGPRRRCAAPRARSTPALRERMPELIEEIGSGVCAAHGAEFELDFTFGYKPVVNDERATGLVRDVVGATSSPSSTRSWAATTSPPTWREAPGCYAFVGAGGEYPAPPPAVPDRRAGARDRDPAPCPGRAPSARGVRMKPLLGSRRRGGAGRPPAPPRRDALARRGAGRGARARARAASGADARRVLARRVRLARGRGRAQRLRAVRRPTACTSSPRATGRRCCCCTAGRAACGSSTGSSRCCADMRGDRARRCRATGSRSRPAGAATGSSTSPTRCTR